jgi:LysM domain.
MKGLKVITMRDTNKATIKSMNIKKIRIKNIYSIIPVAIVLVMLILIFVFSFTLKTNAKENKKNNKVKCYSSILIEDGDTLWSIAEEYKPSDSISTKSYIKEIKAINSLSSDTIHSGNYIIVYYYND